MKILIGLLWLLTKRYNPSLKDSEYYGTEDSVCFQVESRWTPEEMCS